MNTEAIAFWILLTPFLAGLAIGAAAGFAAARALYRSGH